MPSETANTTSSPSESEERASHHELDRLLPELFPTVLKHYLDALFDAAVPYLQPQDLAIYGSREQEEQYRNSCLRYKYGLMTMASVSKKAQAQTTAILREHKDPLVALHDQINETIFIHCLGCLRGMAHACDRCSGLQIRFSRKEDFQCLMNATESRLEGKDPE